MKFQSVPLVIYLDDLITLDSAGASCPSIVLRFQRLASFSFQFSVLVRPENFIMEVHMMITFQGVNILADWI